MVIIIKPRTVIYLLLYNFNFMQSLLNKLGYKFILDGYIGIAIYIKLIKLL